MASKKNVRRSYDVEQVIEAAKISINIRELLINLNMSASGNAYHIIKKFIADNNIDVSHFLGQASNRGKVFGPKRPIEDYLENKAPIGSHALKKKLIASGLFEHKCYRCGLSEWQGEKIPLELDHINGDHFDNSLSNLTILCPNCHALTPTFRGKNVKKNGEEKVKDKVIRKRKEDYNYVNGEFCEITFPKLCKRCGELFKPRDDTQVYCGYSCSQAASRKFEISREELEKLVWEMPTSKIALIYGVSDNAIGKRCEMFGIDKPPRGYWAKVYYGKT